MNLLIVSHTHNTLATLLFNGWIIKLFKIDFFVSWNEKTRDYYYIVI